MPPMHSTIQGKKSLFEHNYSPGDCRVHSDFNQVNEDNVVVWLQIASPPAHTYVQCRGSAGNQYPGRMTPAWGIGIEEDLNCVVYQ